MIALFETWHLPELIQILGAGTMPVEGTLFRPVLLRVEGITGSNTPRWFFSPSSTPGQEVKIKVTFGNGYFKESYWQAT